MTVTTDSWLVPAKWSWTLFENVADIAQNLIDPKLVPDLPHIAPNNIGSADRRLLSYVTVKQDGVISPKQQFKAGQILFTKIRPYLLKSVIAEFEGVCSADMYPVNVKGPIYNRFLLYWLTSPDFRDIIAHRQGRSVLPKINQLALNATPLPLPPLPEQRRIVAKIDSLSAKSNCARDHLGRLSKLVEKLKSNLINALCSNNGEAYYVEDLSSDQRYSLSIGPFGSNLVKSDYRQAGVPLVFVRNIREREFNDVRAVFVEREKAIQLKAHTVNPGDLLITKMGDPPGDVAIYPLNRPAGIITSDCIKLTPRANLASSEYLYYAMQSDDFQRQIRDITKGVAQQKVSLENFRKLQLHVPTLEEQDKICRTLQTMLANVEKLSAQAADAGKLIDRLDQAILSKAFRGKLVPQDPNDEPASVLLERIKAEKVGAVPARRGRGRPRLAQMI